jgi:hypothetical protein
MEGVAEGPGRLSRGAPEGSNRAAAAWTPVSVLTWRGRSVPMAGLPEKTAAPEGAAVVGHGDDQKRCWYFM